MSTSKAVFLAVSIVAIGAAVANLRIVRQRQQRQVEAQEAARRKAARVAELDQLAKAERAAEAVVSPTVSPQTVPETPPAPQPTNAGRRPGPTRQPSTAGPAQPVPARRELQDPMARAALSLVGADPDAEMYWLDAIYNPSLPDREREDLMEDLNEDGLSDSRHPGPEDFPLIMNRITLIDQIAPTADQFMLPHLWEAYKDLWNLAEVAQGRGEPIR